MLLMYNKDNMVSLNSASLNSYHEIWRATKLMIIVYAPLHCTMSYRYLIQTSIQQWPLKSQHRFVHREDP